jgi:hypothetical protein
MRSIKDGIAPGSRRTRKLSRLDAKRQNQLNGSLDPIAAVPPAKAAEGREPAPAEALALLAPAGQRRTTPGGVRAAGVCTDPLTPVVDCLVLCGRAFPHAAFCLDDPVNFALT